MAQKRKIMRELHIGEISGVDRPAQKGALVAIMKRNDGLEGTAVIEKNGAALTSEADGHTHIFALIAEGGDTIKSGITNYAGEGDNWHAHPWIMMDGGPIIIGAANGHIHEVGVTNKNDKQENQEMDKEGLKTLIKAIEWTNEMVNEAQHILDLAKGLDAMDLLPSEDGALADLLKNIASEKEVGTQENPTMTDKISKEAAALVELQAKLDRSEALGSMNDVTKAHFGTLSGAEADAFIAKSQDEREAEVAAISKAAEDQNPVVYKTSSGIEIRKSDGAVTLALAKEADVHAKSNKILVEAASTSDLEKRASALEHIPGDLSVRVAMLKGMDAIEDEDVRKAALDGLAAQNEALSSAFVTIGKQGGTVVVPGSADEQLNVLTKKHQEANPGMSEALAMDAVLKTEEGSALYSKSLN